MREIDTALKLLSDEPVPAQLAGLEDRVLQRVAGHSFAAAGESYRTRVALVAIALGAGVAGGLIPETSEARRSHSPLTGVEELAPSALLAGPR